MAAFPSYAILLHDGYAINRASAVQTSEFDDGMGKQARRFSRVMVDRKVRYWFRSKSEYLTFIQWFKITINYGADWFDWVDPADSITKAARIKGGKLDEEKPFNPILSRWEVSFTLQTWDE